jgi:pentose-5-phosphate-3-epimerase
VIAITPNILTNDVNEFTRQLKRLKEVFNTIDLDVIREPFIDNHTVSVSEFLQIEEIFEFEDLGVHLMVKDYMYDLNLLLKSRLSQKHVRIYVHQETNLTDYLNIELPKDWEKNISLKPESNLRDYEFYQQFSDIQLMTVPTGFQGLKLIVEILERSKILKENFFKGVVSIDGGVNLQSASIIKDYPIDRVSVGSYFVKAEDLELAKMKLDLALNVQGLNS